MVIFARSRTIEECCPRSQRRRSDEELGAKVRASFVASDRTYVDSNSTNTAARYNIACHSFALGHSPLCSIFERPRLRWNSSSSASFWRYQLSAHSFCFAARSSSSRLTRSAVTGRSPPAGVRCFFRPFNSLCLSPGIMRRDTERRASLNDILRLRAAFRRRPNRRKSCSRG
jgi:hypothetical protein